MSVLEICIAVAFGIGVSIYLILAIYDLKHPEKKKERQKLKEQKKAEKRAKKNQDVNDEE